MTVNIDDINKLLEDDFEECNAILTSEYENEAMKRGTVTLRARQPIRYETDSLKTGNLISAHLHIEESILHQIAADNHRLKFSIDAEHAPIPPRRHRITRTLASRNRKELSEHGTNYDHDSDTISFANSGSSMAVKKSALISPSQLYLSSAADQIEQERLSSALSTLTTKTVRTIKLASSKLGVIASNSKADDLFPSQVPGFSDKKMRVKKCFLKHKSTLEKSPYKLILLISYPMILGYLSVSLYILFDYEVITDTSGLRNLTGLVYFAPLEQILITQFYLAFGSSAGTLMEKHYSRFKSNHKDVQSRVTSEKIVAYYFLFGFVTSLLIPIIMIPTIETLVRSFAVSPTNHYNYSTQTLEYAYPILFFGPLVYFLSSGLVPVLRTMNLGIYCLIRQLIGGAIFLFAVTILVRALHLDNSGAAWGIILGELCSGLFFLFNFLEVFHLQTKILITRLQLTIRSKRRSDNAISSPLLSTAFGNSTRPRYKHAQKLIGTSLRGDDIPRIYLKAYRYGDVDWPLFRAFIVRGIANYVGYLAPPLTAMIGIIQHYKYGGANAHRRQISTGLASRYLGTFQSPLTGLIAGITSVIDYYWSSKKYLKFRKAFYAGFIIMFLFTLCYTIIFEVFLSYFVQSYKMDSSYQQNIVRNGRIVFSFITFQTPFYMAVIMAQVFKQDKISILLTFSRLLVATLWNTIYPLVTLSTDYMIHGIAIADIIGGLGGVIYLLTKYKYARQLILIEQNKHKKELNIHKFASITQLEKPSDSVYASLLNKIDETTYEVQGDDIDLDESTEIRYMETDASICRTSLDGSSLSRIQSVKYLSQAEEQSMSIAHKVMTIPSHHSGSLSIIDIAMPNKKSKKVHKVSISGIHTKPRKA